VSWGTQVGVCVSRKSDDGPRKHHAHFLSIVRGWSPKRGVHGYRRDRFREKGSVLLVSGSVFRVSGFGFRASGSVFRVLGSVFRVSGSIFRGLGSVFRGSGSIFRVLDSDFRVSGCVFRVSSSVFRVSASTIRIVNFGFRVPGSRFRPSSFGSRVPGFGYRGYRFPGGVDVPVVEVAREAHGCSALCVHNHLPVPIKRDTVSVGSAIQLLRLSTQFLGAQFCPSLGVRVLDNG